MTTPSLADVPTVPGDDIHLAMALARPGEPVPTEDEDARAGAFHEVLDGAPAGTWSLHLTAGGRVGPLVQRRSFSGRVARATARGVEDGLR